ncbi:hypothetical protein HPB52_024023 [Rhipicephalus sanguineus]|uniref:Uncharacterized protein n=1 Tax=Rhipicephalus sanguineus TaxID=34632 RepID=A0A9D4SV57_RHISA|nr:hypothetical protein HPB52_024023 [Rhipicephalus sanguineus]
MPQADVAGRGHSGSLACESAHDGKGSIVTPFIPPGRRTDHHEAALAAMGCATVWSVGDQLHRNTYGRVTEPPDTLICPSATELKIAVRARQILLRRVTTTLHSLSKLARIRRCASICAQYANLDEDQSAKHQRVEEDKEVRSEPLLGLTSPTCRTAQGSRHKCDKIGGGAGYDDSRLTPCTRPRPVAETQALCPNSIEWIREIVRSVVREEIQKLYGPRQPEVGSIASVIRDEVQQVLHNRHYQPMPTNVEPAPVSTDIRSRTYAEALRMPVSSLPVASPAVPIQMMPPEVDQVIAQAGTPEQGDESSSLST